MSIDTLNTHVSVTPTIVIIIMTEATTPSANSDQFSYSVTVNGNGVDVKGADSVTSTMDLPRDYTIHFLLLQTDCLCVHR